jgi:hypothetical protein
MKPIDKAIFGVVSESSGRNQSERIGGLENPKPSAGNPHAGFDVAGTGKPVYGSAIEALLEEAERNS